MIDLVGNGVSNGANSPARSACNPTRSGGDGYDGLLIDNNTINVLNARQPSCNPRHLGERPRARQRHHGQQQRFRQSRPGQQSATNLQRAFRVTSHSSGSTTVTYSGNTVDGANIGFQWLAS